MNLLKVTGEGTGNPLQYSCLENLMDGGAWWATVHGAAKSWTQLSDFTLKWIEVMEFRRVLFRSWDFPGNGTPLQYSCLEKPMDGGAWWAAVHGVAGSRTRLSY